MRSMTLGSRTASSLTLLLATAALAGCGGDDEAAELVERVPADAVFYGEAVVQPEGDLQAELEDLLAAFPDGEEAGDAIVGAIEDTEDGEEIDFEEDIQPWLGERAAIFFTDFSEEGEGAVLVETEDEGAARDALSEFAGEGYESRDVDGVELYENDEDDAYAVFDGLAASGNVAGVEQAIATRDEDPLSEEDRFTESIERVESELGFAFLDLPALVEQIPEEEIGGSPEEFFELSGVDSNEPVVLGASVEDGTVRVDQVAGGMEITDGEGALGELPSDAVLAFAFSGSIDFIADAFAAGIQQGASEDGLSPEEANQLLEQAFGVNPAEVLEGVETIGLFARGGAADLGGAAFADLAGEEDATGIIEAAEQTLEQSGQDPGPLPSGVEGEGFAIEIGGLPFQLLVTSDGARVLAGTSEEQVAAARGEGVETLEQSGRLDEAREALGDEDFTPAFLLDGELLSGLAGGLGAFVPGVGTAVPYLEPLGLITSGTRSEDDLVITRTAIEIEE